ncbi:hypothetical protein EQW38_08395 [Lactiplantibacillus plantarum]|nr:hypothetical protein EQW38_08395 [Lactiplantibacillus plantarum]QAT33042.1 hypothetical protein EQW06_07445 [Lactiplantibacillus plantarum]
MENGGLKTYIRRRVTTKRSEITVNQRPPSVRNGRSIDIVLAGSYTSEKWIGCVEMKFVIFGGELLVLAAWLIYGRTLPLSLRIIGVIGIVIVSQLAHWVLKAR